MAETTQEIGVLTAKDDDETVHELYPVTKIEAVKELHTELASKVNTADIVDNLESTSTNLPLSANQGYVLNKNIQTVDEKIDSVNNGVTKIKIYVGEDGKIHFVDSAGADSVLPFSNFPYYKYTVLEKFYMVETNSDNNLASTTITQTGIALVLQGNYGTFWSCAVKLNDQDMSSSRIDGFGNYHGNVTYAFRVSAGDVIKHRLSTSGKTSITILVLKEDYNSLKLLNANVLYRTGGPSNIGLNSYSSCTSEYDGILMITFNNYGSSRCSEVLLNDIMIPYIGDPLPVYGSSVYIFKVKIGDVIKFSGYTSGNIANTFIYLEDN